MNNKHRRNKINNIKQAVYDGWMEGCVVSNPYTVYVARTLCSLPSANSHPPAPPQMEIPCVFLSMCSRLHVTLKYGKIYITHAKQLAN
jgi:hypothetical protein